MTEQNDSLRASVVSFERTIARRNVREVAAAAVVALVYGLSAGRADNQIQSLTAVSVGIAAIIVASVLLWFGRTRDITGVPPSDLASAFRRELMRQARLLKLVPVWYIGPLAVAAIIHASTRGATTRAVVVWVVVAAALTALNWWAASGFEKQAKGDLQS